MGAVDSTYIISIDSTYEYVSFSSEFKKIVYK